MHSTPQGRNVRLNSEAASNVRKVVHDRLSWRDESVACDGHAGIAHSCNADPLVDAPDAWKRPLQRVAPPRKLTEQFVEAIALGQGLAWNLRAVLIMV